MITEEQLTAALARADAAELGRNDAQVKLHETSNWLFNAERRLESLGYRRCDIAACNCRSYHDWENGYIAVLKKQREAAESKVKELEAQLNWPHCDRVLGADGEICNFPLQDRGEPEGYMCKVCDLRDEVKELEAKCAEMRDALEYLRDNQFACMCTTGSFIYGCSSCRAKHKIIDPALSSDYGKGWRSPEEYAALLNKLDESEKARLSWQANHGKSPAEVREMLPYLHHLDSCHMPAAPCTCGLEALVKAEK